MGACAANGPVAGEMYRFLARLKAINGGFLKILLVMLSS